MTAPEQPDVVPTESPASPPASAPAVASDPAAQLAAAKKEAADNYDRFLRASADLENFRRRAVREKEELRQFAAARVLEDLLPVLDNLALGLAAAKQPGADAKTLVTGVELVLGQMKTLLAQQGLKEINPAAGQPFDPHQHESISHQASADVPAGHVLSVVRTGFALNGRLLRPASVVLSSGPAQEEKKT
ncbi:MAG TPA: nucleotide exchange factor GrpE [Opitutaceae bacterium]|nr:nucleotide exchange factor GrpE [Opitutaceae bacterium]